MPTFDLNFLSGLLSIILIDLVLAGDNAVVIAMAVRNLPKKQRLIGIAVGAGAAVVLRVALTVFAAKLMDVPYVKLVGGALIAWIGVKLLVDGCPEDNRRRECSTMFQAMTTVVVADLVMSTDNILAVAGASRGDTSLLIFGLALSIPFVVFTSTILTRLMDRYPWVLYLGAAMLGKVAMEMIFTDPWTVQHIRLETSMLVAAQLSGALGVVIAAKTWLRLQPTGVNAASDPCEVKGDEHER